MFGAQPGSAARAGRGARPAAPWPRPTWWSSWSTAAKGWCRATRRLPRPSAARAGRSSWPSTRPTTSAPSRRARALPAGFRPGHRGERRARPRRGRAARRDRQPAARRRRRDGDASTEEEVRHGGHAPGELAVAIVGRPNAGKSSLVNRLLREERMIVSPSAGHDPRRGGLASSPWHRKKVRIVDTAGIRKAGRVARGGRGRVAERAAGAARHRAGRRRGAGRRCASSASPTRTRRSPARPTRPAAASSSPRTSGT